MKVTKRFDMINRVGLREKKDTIEVELWQTTGLRLSPFEVTNIHLSDVNVVESDTYPAEVIFTEPVICVVAEIGTARTDLICGSYTSLQKVVTLEKILGLPTIL